MRPLAALLALVLTGCTLSQPLRVTGAAALATDDVERTVALVARDLGVPRSTFDGLIVRFTREPSRLGDGIVGWTASPYNIWVRVTDQRHDVCQTTLVHELLHVWLWRTTGSADPAHATSGVWDRKNAARSTSEASESIEAKLYRHVCAETEKG